MGSCCSTSKGMGKRIDTVELSTVDSADDASPKTKNSSKRWKRKKTGGDQVGCKDLGHEIDIPGRLIANGGSKVACLYTQQGKKGTNQDAMLVWENFCTRNDTIFCGVFDGHGPFGHMVAKKVRDSLPFILCTQWKANSNGELSNLGTTENANGNSNIEETASPSIDDEWCEPLEVQENEKLPDMYLPLKRSFLKAFRLMDKELKLHPTIDCFCSGTTAVTLVKQGQNLVLGNVGDSRAVLATRDKDNSLIAVQLTVDLKPDLPAESARIHQCKGRVFALQDEPEVARVWLPNNDSPGLAMARAFGDFCLKDFGLISVPDVYYRQLTERDEFIILATDGVWDVLSNKEAIEIVASAPGHTTAARALVDCAVRAWRLKYPTSKNDDCAVVCLFLEQLSVGAEVVTENDVSKINGEATERMAITDEKTEDLKISDSHAVVLEHSGTVRSSDEIVPIFESTEQKLPTKFEGQSKRSLAECISTTEDEDETQRMAEMEETTVTFKNLTSREYPGHKKKVHSVAWNCTGTKLASGSVDQTARVWHIEPHGHGKVKDIELKGHTDSVDQLCWDPKHADLIATASGDKTVRLWDARSGKCAQLAELSGENINITYKPDGTHIAVGNRDDELTILDVRKFKPIHKRKFNYEVNEIAWSTTSEIFFLTTGNGTVEVLAYPSLRPVDTLMAHTAGCYCIAIDPLGRYFAVGSADSLVSLWDISEMLCVRTFTKLESPVRTISFNNTGEYLASASEDLFIDISNVQTGRTVHQIPCRAAMNSVEWNPKSNLLAYAGDDKNKYQTDEGVFRIFGFKNSA